MIVPVIVPDWVDDLRKIMTDTQARQIVDLLGEARDNEYAIVEVEFKKGQVRFIRIQRSIPACFDIDKEDADLI